MSLCNEFICLTLKYKDSLTTHHLQKVKVKAKALGLGSLAQLSEEQLKKHILSREFFGQLKAQLHMFLNLVLRTPSLPIQITSIQSSGEGQKPSKFWLELLGNNHMLVRSVIKRRSWLVYQDVPQEGSWLQPLP